MSCKTPICIDTETLSLEPMKALAVGIGFGIKPHEAYYIPFNGSIEKGKALQMLKPLLENPKLSFIGHNIKYDMHVLANEGQTTMSMHNN
ncbi:MAG: hypothetical protein HYZ48_00595, partial [Chlamydiales bacterium]|nr:hypothetical protein [Chlamydiales bacterium]